MGTPVVKPTAFNSIQKWSQVHLTPLGAVILGSSSYSVVRSHNMSQPDLPAGSPSLVESVPRIFREYNMPHLQYK